MQDTLLYWIVVAIAAMIESTATFGSVRNLVLALEVFGQSGVVVVASLDRRRLVIAVSEVTSTSDAREVIGPQPWLDYLLAPMRATQDGVRKRIQYVPVLPLSQKCGCLERS